MDGIFYAKAAAFIGAAITMGFGSLGPAIGQGIIGMKACENIGKYPESASNIRTAMALSLAVVESSAIYCFIISGALLIFGSRIG
jgi:F-type H+-transporting ATPase subunit c